MMEMAEIWHELRYDATYLGLLRQIKDPQQLCLKQLYLIIYRSYACFNFHGSSPFHFDNSNLHWRSGT